MDDAAVAEAPTDLSLEISNPELAENSVQDPDLDEYPEPTIEEIQTLWSRWDLPYKGIPDGEDAYALDYKVMPYPVSESQDAIRRSGVLPVLILRTHRPRNPRAPLLLSSRIIHKIAKHDGRGAWAGPATSRKYAGSKRGTPGPGNLKRSYRCPRGCFPGREASRLDDMGWHTRATLTARSWAEFGRLWAKADLLNRLDGMSRRLDRQPFYIGTVAIGPTNGLIHVHMLIGGGSRERIREMIWERWGAIMSFDKYDHAWKAIHYILAQNEIGHIKGETDAEYWYRVRMAHKDDIDSYCDGNLQPPFTSDNLELLVELKRRQIARSKNTPLTAERRRERARLGGLAKAARARARKLPVE